MLCNVRFPIRTPHGRLIPGIPCNVFIRRVCPVPSVRMPPGYGALVSVILPRTCWHRHTASRNGQHRCCASWHHSSLRTDILFTSCGLRKTVRHRISHGPIIISGWCTWLMPLQQKRGISVSWTGRFRSLRRT